MPDRIRGRLIRGCLAAALIALAMGSVWAGGATPEGETSVAVVPNLAGAPSDLVIDSRPPPAEGRRVASISLGLQRGFEVDLSARRGRCTRAQAEQFSCPASSRVGGGYVRITATGAIVPGGSQDFQGSLAAFLAAPSQRGDLAGVVVRFEVAGRRGNLFGRLLSRPRRGFAYELRFDRLGGPKPPPGVSVEIKRLHLKVGARRTVSRSGRRVQLSLLRNPPRCGGTWRARSRLVFTDGTQRLSHPLLRCRGS